MQIRRLFAADQAALVVGHPGHETLVHHWLERARPCVFVLTDGSGGSASSRITYSRRLVEEAGGLCGGVFGDLPDRTWYRSILDGDPGPFADVVDRIAAECVRRGVTAIVSDAVELFNPMHDLTNAVAHAVARRLAARGPRDVDSFTYPIERPEGCAAGARATLPLDEAALARKRAAILRYRPLAGEFARYRGLATQDHEAFAADRPGFDWPARPPEAPFYEEFGRARLREGRYRALITYAGHVREIARALLPPEATP